MGKHKLSLQKGLIKFAKLKRSGIFVPQLRNALREVRSTIEIRN